MSLLQRAPKSLAAKAVSILAVLGAGFVLVTSLAVPSSAAPPDSGTKVPIEAIVANDATRAVPTQAQGTTQVAGTVRTAPAGELVQFQRGIILQPGTIAPTRFPFYDVPDGKRLVVEQITGHLVMANGAEMYVRVGPAVGPLHVLAFPGGLDANSETRAIQRSSTTQQMTFFVDAVPGATTPEFDVEIMRLNDTSTSALAQTITMVGRLYDL